MGVKLDVDDEDEGIFEKEPGYLDEGYTSRRHEVEEVYIPEKEVEVLKEIYGRTVVQDFDDIFHYSEEQRLQFQKEHEKLYLLRGKRVKCSKLSEYVENYRLCLDVIDEMAANQSLYTPDEFKERALIGKIHINGLKFPKCVKPGNKKFNWDIIISYISDREKDPKELDELFSPVEDRITDFDPETSSSEIVERIVDTASDGETAMEIDYSKSILNELSKKDKKRRRELLPELDRAINRQLKVAAKKERASYGSAKNVQRDDFQFLRKYDIKKGYCPSPPKFKGEFINKGDVKRYFEALDEYIEDNTVVNYNGKIYSLNDYNTIRLKTVLADEGWDLRKCFVDRQAERRKKKKEKRDKKREKKIKKILYDIQKRKDDRDKKIDGLPQGINEEEYRKGKTKKKGKNKKKKKKYQKMILDVTTKKRYKNLKRYQKEMEDGRWRK